MDSLAFFDISTFDVSIVTALSSSIDFTNSIIEHHDFSSQAPLIASGSHLKIAIRGSIFKNVSTTLLTTRNVLETTPDSEPIEDCLLQSSHFSNVDNPYYGGIVSGLTAKGTFISQNNTFDATKYISFTGKRQTPVESATFNNTFFFGITASSTTLKDGSGGAIYLANNADAVLTVNKCHFLNCTSTLSGGAIYLDGIAKATLTGCAFTNASAQNAASCGGAVFIRTPQEEVVIQTTTFTNCSAGTGGSGGAIFFANGTVAGLRVASCHFLNCSQVIGSGGAVACEYNAHPLTIVASTFVNCSAELGGALSVKLDPALLTLSTPDILALSETFFQGCTATDNRGDYGGGPDLFILDVNRIMGNPTTSACYSATNANNTILLRVDQNALEDTNPRWFESRPYRLYVGWNSTASGICGHSTVQACESLTYPLSLLSNQRDLLLDIGLQATNPQFIAVADYTLILTSSHRDGFTLGFQTISTAGDATPLMQVNNGYLGVYAGKINPSNSTPFERSRPYLQITGDGVVEINNATCNIQSAEFPNAPFRLYGGTLKFIDFNSDSFTRDVNLQLNPLICVISPSAPLDPAPNPPATPTKPPSIMFQNCTLWPLNRTDAGYAMLGPNNYQEIPFNLYANTTNFTHIYANTSMKCGGLFLLGTQTTSVRLEYCLFENIRARDTIIEDIPSLGGAIYFQMLENAEPYAAYFFRALKFDSCRAGYGRNIFFECRDRETQFRRDLFMFPQSNSTHEEEFNLWDLKTDPIMKERPDALFANRGAAAYVNASANASNVGCSQYSPCRTFDLGYNSLDVRMDSATTIYIVGTVNISNQYHINFMNIGINGSQGGLLINTEITPYPGGGLSPVAPGYPAAVFIVSTSTKDNATAEPNVARVFNLTITPEGDAPTGYDALFAVLTGTLKLEAVTFRGAAEPLVPFGIPFVEVLPSAARFIVDIFTTNKVNLTAPLFHINGELVGPNRAVNISRLDTSQGVYISGAPLIQVRSSAFPARTETLPFLNISTSTLSNLTRADPGPIFLHTTTPFIGINMTNTVTNLLYSATAAPAARLQGALMWVGGSHLRLTGCTLRGELPSATEEKQATCQWEESLVHVSRGNLTLADTSFTYCGKGAVSVQGSTLNATDLSFANGSTQIVGFEAAHRNLYCEDSRVNITSLSRGSDGFAANQSLWMIANRCDLAGLLATRTSLLFIPNIASASLSQYLTDDKYTVTFEGTDILPCSTFVQVEVVEGARTLQSLDLNFTTHPSAERATVQIPREIVDAATDNQLVRARLRFTAGAIVRATGYVELKGIVEPDVPPNEGGLSAGIVVGIVFAGLFVIAVVAVIIYVYVRHQRRQKYLGYKNDSVIRERLLNSTRNKL